MNNYISESVRMIDSTYGSYNRIYRDASIVNTKISNSVSIGDFSIIRSSILNDKVEIGRRNTIGTRKDCHIFHKNALLGDWKRDLAI